jgi:hypothetical protein
MEVRFKEADIAKMKAFVDTLDISWEIHLEASVIVDGMRIHVDFDKPAVNTFKKEQ